MTDRNYTIDHLKAIACLLIVGHHLALYGPMSDALRTAVPSLLTFLDNYARMAVQVFLVLGGYLAAATLAPQGTFAITSLRAALGKRFLRLGIPYSAALIVAIVINETVRGLGFVHASVAATPSWMSLLAHLLLLQSMTGYESLFAGIWYVAIDFQLYMLCALWLWLCHKASKRTLWASAGITVLTAASLWQWNLNANLNRWGVYFLGAYGLGMMAWWSAHAQAQRQRWSWIFTISLLGGGALFIEWRSNIAVATACACILAIGRHLQCKVSWCKFQMNALAWIGQRSYCIFLIHFPMCLLVNAEISRAWPNNVCANSLGMIAAILLSIAAGAALYDGTENVQATWTHLRRWHLGVLSTGAIAAILQWC